MEADFLLKVREISVILGAREINLERNWIKVCYDSLQKIYFFCSRGMKLFLYRENSGASPFSRRATLKGKNLFPREEQILFFIKKMARRIPLNAIIEVKNKIAFTFIIRAWKSTQYQGKV